MNPAPDHKREFNPGLFHPYYLIRSGLYENIKDLAPALKGKLLDFGCGSKPYRHLFSCEEYIGVDFANPGHPHDQEQIDVLYDGKRLPFPDHHFDSILCSEVFEHVFNLDEILQELTRVLKPGGKILITCPFVWKEHEVPNDHARYTLFALDHMLSKHSLEKIKLQKSGNSLEAISQLWTVFVFDHIYPLFQWFILLRIPFKFLFFFIPNAVTKLLSGIFRPPAELYLNNIALYKKKA